MSMPHLACLGPDAALRRRAAAGLQAPKAAGRGRPAARGSKAATPSQHVSVPALDSPPLSRSSSLTSQSTGNCAAGRTDEVRRTKRCVLQHARRARGHDVTCLPARPAERAYGRCYQPLGRCSAGSCVIPRRARHHLRDERASDYCSPTRHAPGARRIGFLIKARAP